MGLSSSQGRLLLLTSRLSDIELGETLIAQRQQQLAKQSEKAAKEYQDAISNYKLVVLTKEDGKTVTEDMNYSNMSYHGYLLTTADSKIYLQMNEDGTFKNPQKYNENTAEYEDILDINQEEGTATLKNDTNEIKKVFKLLDGSEFLSNPEVIQNSIMNGTLFVYDSNDMQPKISMENLASETQVRYVLDTSDDAQAESKYEYETARISREDNQYDLEMQQLETQHEAVLKEYDSIKKVISNNVDRTFNLFSDG